MEAASPTHQPWFEPVISCSAAVSRRTALRSVAHSAASHPASRFARLASTSLLGRSAGLRSGLFCGAKRSRRYIRLTRPVGPFACSGWANLPSKHTHMSAEAYPPDGPQISPRQGSQNFSARAAPLRGSVPVRRCVCRAARGKFCARQAGGCAVPDPGRFGNQAFGHATTLTWWSNPISGERTWLTTPLTPTRPSSFSG